MTSSTTASNNVAVGFQSLSANIAGTNNTAVGYNAYQTGSAGSNNTAVGTFSLVSNAADDNTAVGNLSLNANIVGISNVAVGAESLKMSTASNNTALGYAADVSANNLSNSTAIGNGAKVAASNTIQLGNTDVLNVKTSGTITAGAVTYPKVDGTAGQVLTTNGVGVPTWTTPSAGGVPYTGANAAVNLGAYNLTVNGIKIGIGGGSNNTNTANGKDALLSNISGSDNTAIGNAALTLNTGAYNTATGSQALSHNVAGTDNTAMGYGALYSNISGSSNSAIGDGALFYNTGSNNISVGSGANDKNTSGNDNTAIGYHALQPNTTGSKNTAIGSGSTVASAALTNATAIGYGASVAASNTIQLGNTDVTNVKTSGTITAGTVTYPKAHGTANQVLSTTGSGTLAWTTPAASSAHYIGEAYGGGIVFYVYDGGMHGLIAATTDQSSSISWCGGCIENDPNPRNTRARADGINAGLKNTAIIIANLAAVSSNESASTVCNEYSVTETLAGLTTTYGDWYLPSKYELNLLYLQKIVIGGFSDANYWSSSESTSTGAWYQYFGNGVTNDNRKDFAGRARAIRAF
jgi:hypothetical protein